jgi:hypothetical protein
MKIYMKLINLHRKHQKPNISQPKEPTGIKHLSTTMPPVQKQKSEDLQLKNPQQQTKKLPKNIFIVILVVYLLLIGMGITTGYFLARNTPKSKDSKNTTSTANISYTGPVDTSQFTDSASGTLEKGGIDGEGTHKLVREGGPSQTAYLTSSVIDLDQFVGKKVKVWGQTIAGEKASWLMDVGKIEELTN